MAIILSIILLFVAIGTLIFVHVCIVGRALSRAFGSTANPIATAERRITTTTTTTATTNTDNNHNNGINTSLYKDDLLEKLPCFDYMITKETSTSHNNRRGSVDCAVCLDSFEVGDKCRLLPLCNHSFHAHCVDVWLLRTPFCPICRASAEARDYCIEFESQQQATVQLN